MLEVKNLSIKIKDRYFVKDLSFVLNPKDKLAIIGEEGNGKATVEEDKIVSVVITNTYNEEEKLDKPEEPTPEKPEQPVTPPEPDDGFEDDVLGDKVQNTDKKSNDNIKEDDSLNTDVLGDGINNKSKKTKTSDDQNIMMYGGLAVVTLLGFMLLKKKKASEE